MGQLFGRVPSDDVDRGVVRAAALAYRAAMAEGLQAPHCLARGAAAYIAAGGEEEGAANAVRRIVENEAIRRVFGENE